jgi:hypothetical protein
MDTRKTYIKKLFPGSISFFKRISAVFLQIFTALAILAAPGGMASADTNLIESTALPYLFKTEKIDTPKKFHWMSDRNLRLDTNKRPHIVYGGDNLYYLHFNGTIWVYETIDPSPGTGKYASLALDNNNRPHVSYYDTRYGALKYARKTGNAWETFTIDAPPGSLSAFQNGENIDIDDGNLDSLGKSLHSFYELFNPENYPQPDLTDQVDTDREVIVDMILDDYLVEDSDIVTNGDENSFISIEIQAAANTTGRGLYSSIAVNSAGIPFISYYDAGNGTLKFTRWNGTAWDIRTLDSSGNVGLFTSLGLDNSGQPHISYYDATLGNLKYIRWTGTTWSPPIVVDNGGGSGRHVGLFSSITLDPDKNPHISYYDSYYGNLKYAKLFNGSWLTYVIDNGSFIGLPLSDVGLHTSIAMDALRNVYISYYNSTTADLKLAACTGLTCKLQTLVSDGAAGLYTSIALDGSNPRISFYEANSGYLKYIGFSNGIWQLQNIDRAGDAGQFSSMVLNNDGHPHIAFYDEVTRRLKYAYWDGSQWNLSYVDEMSEAGAFASLALHPSSGQARISYYDIRSKSLKYAAWNGSSWNIQVVDSGPEAGMHSTLALDTSGQPRIAYCRGRGCATGNIQDTIELKAAVFNGSSWDIRPVAGGGTGMFSDIAVDKNGAIHISSYDAAAKVLKYAKGVPDGSSWDVQTADNADKVGLFTSITVDSGNNPHIAYLDDNRDSLRYAFWNGSWQSMLVDRDAPVGWYPSIALDKNDNPNISYYDYGNGSLKHIRKSGSNWISQVVDNDFEVGKFSSLALKNGTDPVISYYDANNGDLKLASTVEVLHLFLPVIRR